LCLLTGECKLNHYKLEDTISNTLKSFLHHPEITGCSGQPLTILKPNEIPNTQYNQESFIIGLKLLNNPCLWGDNYWVLNCTDREFVTVEYLKAFKKSLSFFPGTTVKGSLFTSHAAFSREAFDYAFKNKIGLARVSPTFFSDTSQSIADAVYSTSPLELKNALCDNEFGKRRKKFYGFTTEGKIEHLGSLENYIRTELSPLKTTVAFE